MNRFLENLAQQLGIIGALGAYILLYLLPPVPFTYFAYFAWKTVFHFHEDALWVGGIAYATLLLASFHLGNLSWDTVLEQLLNLLALFLLVAIPVAVSAGCLYFWRGWTMMQTNWVTLGVYCVSAFTAQALFASYYSNFDVPDDDSTSPYSPRPLSTLLRGNTLMNLEQALARAEKLLSTDDEEGLLFGGVRLRFKSFCQHFLFLGATGSGKTLSLLMLLYDGLKGIGNNPEHCALIYDGKNELLPYLPGLAPFAEIRITNPADARSARWDIAADIRTEKQAIQFASTLFPDDATVRAAGGDPYHDSFFRNAPRDIMVGVIVYFIQQRAAWDLRDLVLTLRSEDRLREVLSKSRKGKRRLEYFRAERSGQDILSSIKSQTASLELIAAWGQHSQETFSLRDWLGNGEVLVLGADDEAQVVVDTFNQILFRLASGLLVGQTNSTGRRNWVVLDEVREAGMLNIRPLALRGRSKGIGLVVTLQDRDGFISLYKREGADEILGQLRHKAIFGLSTPESQKWASELFGTREELFRLSSTNHSSTFTDSWPTGFMPQGSPSSSSASQSGGGTSESFQTRPTVLPGEFSGLPPASPETGLHGFYMAPSIGMFYSGLPGDFVDDHLPSPDFSYEELERRPDRQSLLKEWGLDDLLRLGLKPEETPDPKSSKDQEIFGEDEDDL